MIALQGKLICTPQDAQVKSRATYVYLLIRADVKLQGQLQLTHVLGQTAIGSSGICPSADSLRRCSSQATCRKAFFSNNSVILTEKFILLVQAEFGVDFSKSIHSQPSIGMVVAK